MSAHLPTLKGESFKIIFIILIGWTCFSVADTIVKILAANHAPSVIVTLGAIVNCVIISLWILKKKGVRGFLTPQWKIFFIRGLMTGVTSYTIVNAFALIPMADVYGLTFFAPLLSVILAAFFLKESVGWHRITAVIIGFIGVLILVGPQYEHLNIGLIYAAIATISIALGTILLRKIGTKDVYIPLLVLYSYMGMLCVNLPIAFSELSILPSADMVLVVANAAILLMAISLTTYATSHAQSTASVAPFVYIQAVWGVVFGYIFFEDIPTKATIAGLIIVVSAGLYMIYRERQLGKVIEENRT